MHAPLSYNRIVGGKTDAKTSSVYCSDCLGVGLCDRSGPGLQKDYESLTGYEETPAAISTTGNGTFNARHRQQSQAPLSPQT